MLWSRGIILSDVFKNSHQRIVFALFYYHVWKIETFFNCLTEFLIVVSFLLRFLEILISFQALSNYPQVGVYFIVENLDILHHVFEALPAFQFLEQAEVCDDHSRCPTCAWGAVDIDVEVLAQHTIQVLGCEKKVRLKLLLFEVVNREPHWFNISLLVILFHFPPRESSLPVVIDCHEVDDSRDSSLA